MKQQPLLLHCWLFLLASVSINFRSLSANPVSSSSQEDVSSDRKLLRPSGTSEGTSGSGVSLIMDHPNGTKTYITDGEFPLSAPPPVVGSPASLMAPDRYEFYSFGKDGELVKKLMTLDQIQSSSISIIRHFLELFVRQGLIAGGDELLSSSQGHQSSADIQGAASSGGNSREPPSDFYQQPLVQAGEPEGVNKVLESVQNVLKSELQTAHVPDHVDIPPIADDSWSILLPGFLNGELDFKEPLKPTVRPLSVSKLPPINFPPSTSPPAPPRLTTMPSSTVSSTLQPVRVTTPRRPISSSQSPFKPSTKTTATKPPTVMTTVKYSAHYTTAPPTVKTKPASVIKKPTTSQMKPSVPIRQTVRPSSTSSQNFTSTESTRNNFTVVPAARPQNSSVTVSTTYKPTTAKETVEKSKPSGIPTITHYLPIQSSINPSDAVKTPKPALPSKNTTKPTKSKITTPKPITKPTETYLKTQSVTITSQATYKPSTLSTSTTEEPPIAEKLVQRQPPIGSLHSAGSDMISVSVSTPSGPPSTLKMTAGTTVRPSRPTQASKPVQNVNKTPVVTIQPNKTRTTTTITKPLTTITKKEPAKFKPRPTPSVSTSSVATHKPVLVMNSKPPGLHENVSSTPVVSTTWAPLSSFPKNATFATKYGTYTTSKYTPMVTKFSPQPTTTTMKYIPPATTVQSRLPTGGASSVSPTQSPSTTILATTASEIITTLSNELAHAPLKLADSLKEPEPNFFEKVPLLASTMKDMVLTTEGTTRWQQISDATSGSTLATTITEPTSQTLPGSTIVTTDMPTTFNRVFIINNSEPQTMRTPLCTTERLPTTETQAPTSTFGRMTTSAEPSPTTLMMEMSTTVSTATREGQTTLTEPPSMTTFKDPVMEDGISAVASILLDEKISADNNPLLGRLTTPETTATATEISSTIRQETTVTEGATFRQDDDKNQTTTLKADESEFQTSATVLPSATTMADVSTTMAAETAKVTTMSVKNVATPFPQGSTVRTTPTTTTRTNPTTTDITTIITTEPSKTVLKSSTTEKPSSTTKKDENVSLIGKPKLPIKESKLNPESDFEAVTEAQNNSTDGTTMMMEQVKLTEKNSVPSGSPPSPAPPPALKTPNQENKIPYPAFKRPGATAEGSSPPAIELHPPPYESMGAEASTAFLAEDVRRFADLCNELAFRLWTAVTAKGQISSRSLVMSPFAAISLLAMVFLGARGATSGQMNDILRLDDMVTFNPHQVLQNVTDSVINSKNHGVATAAFVRELYSDKSRGKILNFYKERAQQYYGGHVEEVSFGSVGDVIRRRTNLLVKRQTLGKVPEYLKGSSLNLRPPLAAFSANIFQTDCESGSTEGRDGEMYFVVRPSTRQRRLVPVPAVVWRSGFSAGYEPSLDATSVCLGQDSVVSTLLILPGQQGQVAPGDGLARLEQRLIETSYRRGGWSRLLRSLLPRPGLELQVPRFSHRSVLNVTSALARMGLKDLLSFKADLRGLNGGATDLHLSDMVQVNTFSTCGEEVLGARHHIETYPASPQRTGREDPTPPPHPSYVDFGTVDVERRPRYHFNGDDVVDGRPRSGRLPLPSSEPAPRLRFDRPFLYIVRHNPSGIVLHIGRFNPRLLP